MNDTTTTDTTPTALSERLGVHPSTLQNIGTTRRELRVPQTPIADSYKADPALASILGVTNDTKPSPAWYTARVTQITNTGKEIPRGEYLVTPKGDAAIKHLIKSKLGLRPTLAVISNPQTPPTTPVRVIISHGLPDAAQAYEHQGSRPGLVTIAVLSGVNPYRDIGAWIEEHMNNGKPEITLTFSYGTEGQYRTKHEALRGAREIADTYLSQYTREGFVRILMPAQPGVLWQAVKHDKPVDTTEHEPREQANTRRLAVTPPHPGPNATDNQLKAWHESFIQNLRAHIPKLDKFTRAGGSDIHWAVMSIESSEQSIWQIDNPEPEEPVTPKTGVVTTLVGDEVTEYQYQQILKHHQAATINPLAEP